MRHRRDGAEGLGRDDRGKRGTDASEAPDSCWSRCQLLTMQLLATHFSQSMSWKKLRLEEISTTHNITQPVRRRARFRTKMGLVPLLPAKSGDRKPRVCSAPFQEQQRSQGAPDTRFSCTLASELCPASSCRLQYQESQPKKARWQTGQGAPADGLDSCLCAGLA